MSGAIELAVRQRAGRRARAGRSRDDVGTRRTGARRRRDRCATILERAREHLQDGVRNAQGPSAGQRRVARRGARRLGPAGGGGTASLRYRRSGPHVRLVGRGPALFAEDQRVLEAFAAAARTAYEGGVLSDQAEEAAALADGRPASEPRCWPLSDTICARHWRGSRRRSARLRQTDVEWSDAERRELLTTIEESTDRLDGVIQQLARREPPGGRSAGCRARRRWRSTRWWPQRCWTSPTTPERVDVGVTEDLPLVLADSGLLKRVLVNVLENALGHGAQRAPGRDSALGRAPRASSSRSIDHGQGVSAARA